uniref:Uncharacterized protein n=1 Tax=Myotis myotis TaxID=51298 RepID=A0A7J7XZZ6_MYOMY|nr:hypothetical protein mMyoMyo1_011473 [Myotis myotis]
MGPLVPSETASWLFPLGAGMTVTVFLFFLQLPAAACGPAGAVSLPFHSPPVAIRHDPLLAPHGQPQLCGFSPRRPRGLCEKEPIGDAELWFPGDAWLLGGAAPRKPKAPDPQAPCKVWGTSPSQPSVAPWCPHGGAPWAAQESVASPSQPRGLGL